jgi:hypothetical protein
MNTFYENLKGVEKVMYKSAFNFHMKYHAGATNESAHEAGLKELKRLGKLREEHSKPEMWVDITTGEKHLANY